MMRNRYPVGIAEFRLSPPESTSIDPTYTASFQGLVDLSYANRAIAMPVYFCTDVRDIMADNATTFTLDTSLKCRHPAQGQRFELSWQMIFHRFGRPFANCSGSSRLLKS